MSAEYKDWAPYRSKGFADYPEYRPALGTETLFRVFGGARSRITGEFYTFDKPRSLTAAELNLNVAKWGNLCLYVATFHVTKGTPMYIGRIDQSFHTYADGGHEIFLGGNPNAKQVWIEYHKAMLGLRLVGEPERLLQDAFIVAPGDLPDA